MSSKDGGLVNRGNGSETGKDGGLVNRGNGSETDKEANKQAKIYVCIRCSMLINYA